MGSQKCGTSWWFSLLNAHPDVQAQTRKEVRTLLAFRKPMEPADVAEYLRWFPRPPGKRTGEWTPSYMTVSWLGRAIEEAAPEARLLALVRDPVERYRSGLPQWRKYHSGEIDDDLEEQQAVRQALRRGFYGAQLTQLADAVGRERILVLQYERSARDPRGEFQRTLEFLGLSPWDPPDELLARRPAASSEREPLSDGEREKLVERYAPDVRILRSFAPDLDLSLWPNFAYALASPPDRGDP